MKWFERGAFGGAQRAKFQEVGTGQRRVPSWLPGRPAPERRNEGPGQTSLKPPKLPSEFVDAVRSELDHEYAGRARRSLPAEGGVRRSETPQLSIPPVAALPAVALKEMVAPEPVRAPEPAAPDPQLVAAFEHALALLGHERERLLTETAVQVAELALLIARRVIARELSLDPMLVRELVREGIEALGQHDRVVVRLGSAFASTREALEDDLKLDGGRVEVRIDATLHAYGCLVETDLGQVDESIESRLQTLLLALNPGANAT
jgi:flagellar assembly protein FliH